MGSGFSPRSQGRFSAAHDISDIIMCFVCVRWKPLPNFSAASSALPGFLFLGVAGDVMTLSLEQLWACFEVERKRERIVE